MSLNIISEIKVKLDNMVARILSEARKNGAWVENTGDSAIQI